MDTIGAIAAREMKLQRQNGSSPVPVERDSRSGSTPREPQGGQEVDQEEVGRAAEQVNYALDALNRNLKVSVHKDTGHLIVRVTDPKSGELIRQLPPEQLLDAEVNIKKVIGLFVDETG